MSGRFSDRQGYPLMAGDSTAAAQQFGFDGIGLRNVPKSKFMFYAKFNRARSQGGSPWERNVAFAVKSLDRPRVSFKTETLNQYNRKRVIQTDTEFEALSFKFHDTVTEHVQNMFNEYYEYYFNDIKAYSKTVTNDIVKQQMDPAGPFGMKAIENTDGFFSHITIYQLFNGNVSVFEVINPKIQSFNPDDLDYAQHDSPNEIQLTVEFEGITYRGISKLTPELATEMGLSNSAYYDLQELQNTPTAPLINPGYRGVVDGIDNFDQFSASLSGEMQGDDSVDNILFRSLGSDSLNSFNKNTGVATAQLGLGGLGNLLKGDTGNGIGSILGLDIFGKPSGIL